MSTTIIKNAKIVNENSITESDLLIKDERIVKIGSNLEIEPFAKIIEARGRYLIPGMIDTQVHFREPGLEYKANIETESKAAIAGGVTSYFEMPNVTPLTDNIVNLQAKKDIAKTKSYANYSFYLGATNNNLEEIKKLDPKKNCGIKIFMGSSTGNMLVDDDKVLNDIFANARSMIATHCEDDTMIQAAQNAYQERFGDNPPAEYHADIRSRQACFASSSKAVALAKKHKSRLHVLHISTKEELDLFDPIDDFSKLYGANITAEACVHHLFFKRRDYTRFGNLIKCNPSIKDEEDKLALLEAVKTNKIAIIATDHAPHTWDEKQETYFKAPSGIPLVQHALLSLFEQIKQGRMTIENLVQKTAHAPALRFGIADRGFIKEGYFADLVLADLTKKYKVTSSNILYKCAWSPFNEFEFNGCIDKVIINGTLAYADNKVFPTPFAKELEFK